MIRAFHSEPGLKTAVLNRLREHRRLDQIVQGTYWEDGRGCHLGCLTHVESDTHEAAERLFGLEQRIGYWLEAVFEGLPKKHCAAWVCESIEAIPVGADLSRCHHHFGAWLLGESGLLTITDINRDAIQAVQQLHQRAAIAITTDEEWSAVESAARSAARSAAESAWSAAESARSARSARSAARSAAAELVESAARSAAWKKIAAKSIEIFRSAPVDDGASISVQVRQELCCRQLWCPEQSLIAV